MATEEKRVLYHLEALDWLQAWGLVFSEKLRYEEVWGERPQGLTQAEVTEVAIAYDEWDRMQKAVENWKRGKDKRDERGFDMVEYIEKRREEIMLE